MSLRLYQAIMITSAKMLKDEMFKEKIDSYIFFNKIKAEEHEADQNVHK